MLQKTGDNNQALESEVEYELTSKKAHHHSLRREIDIEDRCQRCKDAMKIFYNFDSSCYFC